MPVFVYVCLLIQQREAIIAMLTAVIHISDIKFLHDSDTDGVYIENEDILEIGLFRQFVSFYTGGRWVIG